MKTIPAVLVLTALAALSSSCRPSERKQLEGAEGPYRGFVMIRDGQLQQEQRIAAEITRKGVTLTLAIRSIESDLKWDIDLKVASAKRLELDQSSLELRDDDCFSTSAAGASLPEKRLCADEDELSLELAGKNPDRVTFVLNRAEGHELPTFEIPASFTLDQLREQARDRAFESRIEFEQALQGQLNAQNAWASLLPRLTIGDILGLVSFNWTQLLHSAGNFFPFLFPNRWYRAHGAAAQERAAKASWLLMRANSARIAESLALSVLRDAESAESVRSYLPRLVELRERVLERERLDIDPPGTSDDITAAIDSLQRAIEGLEQVSAHERTALAESLGFLNPNAIAEVRPSELVASVLAPKPFDLDGTRLAALDRSLELRQLDALIDQARRENRARYWDVVDPSGGGLSFTIPGTIAISRSSIRVLEDQRERAQAQLLQRVEDSRIEHQSVLRQHALAVRAIETHERRLARLEEALRLDLPVSFSELQLVTLDLMRSQLDRINAKYAYASAVSGLERLRLSGAYVDLYPPELREPEKPEPSPSPSPKP